MTVLKALCLGVIAAIIASPLASADETDISWFFNQVRVIDPQAGSDADIALAVQTTCWRLKKQGYKATGRNMVSAGYSETQAVQLINLYRSFYCPEVVDPPFAS